MSDDSKIIDLGERRKREMPVAQTGLRDIHDIVLELIATLEAHGTKRLVGTYKGGWSFSVERSSDNGDGNVSR